MGKLMNACIRAPALAGMGYARETMVMDVRKLALAEALLINLFWTEGLTSI